MSKHDFTAAEFADRLARGWPLPMPGSTGSW